MTGPFLIILQTVKYIIKYGTLYYLYRKGKDHVKG
jgi:mannose/fructose/N-acetylgalactosamine-specific phosphotransferase system component IID